MKLQFFVTEEDYLAVLQYLLKRKMKSFWGMFSAFLFTFGQLIGVILFCLGSGMEWKARMLLIALSSLVCGMNCIWRLPTVWKAKGLFKRMKREGQWDQEYEKQHTLVWEENKLCLRYGKIKRKLPAVSISELVEYEKKILIMTGEVLFAVLPENAFSVSAETTKEQWLKSVRDKKYEESKQQIRKKQNEMKASGRRPYCYIYSLDQYRSDMKASADKTYIRVIRRLLNQKEEKEFLKLLSFHPEKRVELYITDKEIVILGEIHYFVIDQNEIIGKKWCEDCVILYLNNGISVPVSVRGKGRSLIEGMLG